MIPELGSTGWAHRQHLRKPGSRHRWSNHQDCCSWPATAAASDWLRCCRRTVNMQTVVTCFAPYPYLSQAWGRFRQSSTSLARNTS